MGDAVKLGAADAIKELLKDEFAKLQDKVDEQEKKQDEFAKELEKMSGKVVEREQDATKLREEFEKHSKDTEEAIGKLQTQLTDDLGTMKGRLDKFEDDDTGLGGLKQVHQKMSDLEKSSSEMTKLVGDSSRLVNSHTEGFDRKLKDLSRQCNDMLDRVKASEDFMKITEGKSSSVGKAQQALEDMVTRKYETLWQDVLRAIEEVKGTQQKDMELDKASQYSSIRSETKSMVNYALNMMSQAHGERRQMAINKSLLTAWKEQTWITARRNLGLSLLHKLTLNRQRQGFDRWSRRHSTNLLCHRLQDQYENQLATVYKRIQDGDNTLQSKVNDVDRQVAWLTETKAAATSLDESLGQIRFQVDQELKALVPINAKIQDMTSRHDLELRALKDTEVAHDTKIGAVVKDLQDVIESLPNYAKSDEVKNMIRDILLIWNSIKQIDSAKADKKDVDIFAIETGNRDKLTARNLEDLRADITTRSRQDIVQLQEKWNVVDGRLDESARNFRHWEQMWEQLAGFVEDLVSKIGELQAGEVHHKFPATLRPTRISRTKLAPNRPDIPVMHETSAARADSQTRLASTETLESKMLWLNSAKGLVDATIEQAMTPGSARAKIGRPKSASMRGPYGARPHDRGM